MQVESCQENSYEDLLRFNEVYLGIFYAFSMKGKKIKDKTGNAISNNDAVNILNKFVENDKVAEWDDKDHYAKGFEYAQKFFFGKLPNNLIRIKLNGLHQLDCKPGEAATKLGPSHKENTELQCRRNLSISYPLGSSSTKHDLIPIEVYLSIFPDNDIGVLFFNIKLSQSNELATHCSVANNLTTDNLIFLIHCLFEDRFDVDAIIPNYLKIFDISDGKNKMGYIVKKYVELVLRAFDVENINKLSNSQSKLSHDIGQTVKKRILEIRDSGNSQNLDNAEDFLKNYPKQTYGLMEGDEGWRFVPTEFSRLRILERWGSRDFMSVLTSSVGVILLNFRNTDHYKLYVNTEKTLRESHQNPVEDYFNFNYDISGMEHGAFLCLEKAVLTRLILDQQIDRLYNDIKGSDEEKKQSDRENTLRKITRIIVDLIIGDREAQRRLKKISIELNELYKNLNQIYSENKIWEIERIYKNINKTFELDEDLIKTKSWLGDYFNQQYSVENNKFISTLTNLGLRLAVVSIMVGSILTIIGLYLSGAQIYLGEPGHDIAANLSEYFQGWLRACIDPLFT